MRWGRRAKPGGEDQEPAESCTCCNELGRYPNGGDVQLGAGDRALGGKGMWAVSQVCMDSPERRTQRTGHIAESN